MRVRSRWGSIRSCAPGRRSLISGARRSRSASAISGCAAAPVRTTSARSPRASAGTRRPVATAPTCPSTRFSALTRRSARSRPTTRTRPRAGVNYSALALLRGALSAHRNWVPVWRSPEPKPAYDVVIVGGGGHGLATAYYLAKNHRVRHAATLERGWIGGGNTGRNTTIVRSNYLFPESARLYEFALKCYEGLSRELNFNIMLSQRGLVMLAHSRHDLDSMARWANAMRMNGIDAEILTRQQVAARAPLLDMSPDARFPVLGGFSQRRARTARAALCHAPRRPLPGAGRLRPAAPRPGAPRRGGLGLRARSGRARGGHH